MAESEMGQTADLTNCDREQIHVPGAIQPHGLLATMHPRKFTLTQVSSNTREHCDFGPDELVGAPLERLLGDAQGERLRRVLSAADGNNSGENLAELSPLALALTRGGQEHLYHGVLHHADGVVVLEMEPVKAASGGSFLGFYRQVRDAVGRLQEAGSLVRLCQVAVEEVRWLTGFDRVMVYRFDEQWNGQVLAEEKKAGMDAYLGLHFPASDIPVQARALYRINRLRFVVDSSYQAAPLVPALDPTTGRPLNMSFSVLRSVSPVHLEYLRNMGVGASLSVSIMQNGQLWGLIACHHQSAKYVPYETRVVCEFIGQTLSSQLAVQEAAEDAAHALRLRLVRDDLVSAMTARFELSGASLVGGLSDRADRLLELGSASGAALCLNGETYLFGAAPAREQVAALAIWLRQQYAGGGRTRGVFSTHSLPLLYADAHNYASLASGLLAVSVSKAPGDCVLWFRPEAVSTIRWAGDPHKPVSRQDEQQTLRPRTSFAAWQETVRATSLPWTVSEEDAARDLGNALTSLALRGAAQELVRLNGELARSNQELDSFAYIASHDMKAPLRGIANLANWIEEELGDGLTDDVRDMLEKLHGRVKRMESIVEGILQYARIGRVVLKTETVDVREMLEDLVDLLAPRAGMRVEIGPEMPTFAAERLRLHQVFQNLISNAIKHNVHAEGHVQVSVQRMNGFYAFTVADDGPGIAPQFHKKIFEIFQTLEARDTTENTGIGLSLIKKIVEGQGGRVWVESQAGQGAAFHFTWPADAAAPAGALPPDTAND